MNTPLSDDGLESSLADIEFLARSNHRARVLAVYGVRGSALFVALSLLVIYFVSWLRLGDGEEAEAVTGVGGPRPEVDS